ncbi:MAG: DNA mismatch repair endonuclease MutL [Pseudomonadota bacterium]
MDEADHQIVTLLRKPVAVESSESALPRRAIRLLDASAQNRIAAGEVIERPASAVKELVENAIDAMAGRIAVTIIDGGRSLIRVADDGIGIPSDELALAVQRHATSKIDGGDLVNIATLGFRGEALPSIGAVARLVITSRPPGQDPALIEVVAGAVSPVRPAARAEGTTVEIRDLFSATPARLKFLKSARAETLAIVDTLRRLALSRPALSLTLDEIGLDGREGRRLLDLPAVVGSARADADAGSEGAAEAVLRRRARAVIGEDAESAVWLSASRDALTLTGLAGAPARARGAASHQYLSVNGRPVRDRLLLGAVRAGYGDYLARGRHPAFVLDIACPAEAIDVNVHPGKAEVRFRDAAGVRALIVGRLRAALAEGAPVAGQALSAAALGAVRPAMVPPEAGPVPSFLGQAMRRRSPGGEWRPPPSPAARHALNEAQSPFHCGPDETSRAASSSAEPAEVATANAHLVPDETAAARPLGTARAQIHGTYILAETAEGLVLVDQHAAHERLVLERLKAERATTGVIRQALLIPEIVSLGAETDSVLAAAKALGDLGLGVEAFGPGTVCVREVPAILGDADPAALIRDVAAELADAGTTEGLQVRLDAVLSRIACHGSVRAGRRLALAEMDALLRQIETTPGAQWCNHGRPTAVTLDKAEIERLFERR